jgi:chromosome segregation ATPase
MAESKSGISYERVASVIQKMINSNVNPTVRAIMDVTGGKTDTVNKHKFEFFEKRDIEISKMADELGSGAIAGLIASEMQVVVDRRTGSLNVIVERQKEQLEEMVGLLEAKEEDCQTRVDAAEAQSIKAENDANDKVSLANDKAELAQKAQADIEAASRDILEDCEKRILGSQQRAETLVEGAKNEADALVNAANKQTDKAESEARLLRQQVNDLAVEQAKHGLEKAQFEKTQELFSALQIEVAQTKTSLVKLETENHGLNKDVRRLERDLDQHKETTNKFSQAQAQLVELQKQFTQSQHDLSQAGRERDSLSQALSRSNKEN